MLHDSGFIYSQFQRSPRVFDIGPHFETTFFPEVISDNLYKGKKTQVYKPRGQSYLFPKEAQGGLPHSAHWP